MTPDDLKTIITWGERMAREARRLATRRLPEFGWARSLEVLSRRVVERPVPSPARFRRREALPVPPPLKSAEINAMEEPETPPLEEGEPIPSRVRDRLRDLAGLRDEPMRLHRDDLADRIAQSHRADAVTIGPDVFVRGGRARPEEPRGLALLAHEATHIIEAMRPGASWRRATKVGLDEEEREARYREQAALAPHGGLVASPARTSASGPAAAPRLAAPQVAVPRPAERPMTAEIDRPVPAPAPPPATVDLDALRRSVYRDIQDKIRSDHERGG